MSTITFPKREREILELICRGSNSKHIADELEISISTVNAHRARISIKTGVAPGQLFIYGLQTPLAFVKGGQCMPGLHEDPCPCDSPYCAGKRRVAA